MKAHETFREWILENYDMEELKNISSHGCLGGIHGLIYHFETVALYEKYKEDIWELIYADYEDLGYASCLDMIISFGGSNSVNSDQQFKTLMVWYYVEEIARRQMDIVEHMRNVTVDS